MFPPLPMMHSIVKCNGYPVYCAKGHGSSYLYYVKKRNCGLTLFKMSDEGVIDVAHIDRKKQPSSSGIKNFFAGGFGGTCCIATGHPLDTIKV